MARFACVMLIAAACSGSTGPEPTTSVTDAPGVATTIAGPLTGTSAADVPAPTVDAPTSTPPTTDPASGTAAPTTSAPAPTTTAPPADPTPAPAGSAGTPPDLGGTLAAGSIGVVGCSNTSRSVNGYLVVSEYDLLAEGGLDAGSMGIWGSPGTVQYERFWGAYDDRRPAGGYAGTWVQLCPRDRQHSGVFDESHKGFVEHIVEAVHQRDPGIPIWMSGINSFEDGLVCVTAGVEGPAITAEAADWAAATIPGVSRGPDLGPMVASHLDPGETCHPNAEGRLFLGGQLAAFFDGG